MKLRANILIILLSFIYLLPSTGIFYVKHYCMLSGTSKIVWQDGYNCHGREGWHSCCSPEHESRTGSAGHCLSGEQGKCCSNEVHYLKDTSEYDKPLSTVVTKRPLRDLPVIIACTITHDPVQSLSTTKEQYPPPVSISGKLFISHRSLIL